jgi:hypothetical protein
MSVGSAIDLDAQAAFRMLVAAFEPSFALFDLEPDLDP